MLSQLPFTVVVRAAGDLHAIHEDGELRQRGARATAPVAVMLTVPRQPVATRRIVTAAVGLSERSDVSPRGAGQAGVRGIREGELRRPALLNVTLKPSARPRRSAAVAAKAAAVSVARHLRPSPCRRRPRCRRHLARWRRSWSPHPPSRSPASDTTKLAAAPGVTRTPRSSRRRSPGRWPPARSRRRPCAGTGP